MKVKFSKIKGMKRKLRLLGTKKNSRKIATLASKRRIHIEPNAPTKNYFIGSFNIDLNKSFA